MFLRAKPRAGHAGDSPLLQQILTQGYRIRNIPLAAFTPVETYSHRGRRRKRPAATCTEHLPSH